MSSPETTSNQTASNAANLNAANLVHNQQPSNVATVEDLNQLNNGICNFIFPSEEDSARASEENLDPNSAGSVNSRTGGVWNKSLEEAHSAEVKERSLLGHLMCSEETQKKILESDIFRILKSEGVTEIGALYKVSPSKFVLVFGSKAAKEKLENTEIQCRFGDFEICLNFHKRVGPLRNGREPIFVTIFLPEFISDQAVRLAFSRFGDVISVFKGRHKFNTDVRNGKRHVKIFPAGEDPAILPRKITFHGRIQRDVLFAEKVVLCYRWKTRHILGENCPVVTPAQEDSSMSLPKQSSATAGGAAPVQQESSLEIQPLAESQQASSPISEEAEEGDSSGEDGSGSGSESGSTSESDDEGEPDLESSAGPSVPSEDSPDLPSRENLPVIQGAQTDQGQDSQRPGAFSSSKENQTEVTTKPTISEQTEKQSVKPKRTLKSLKYFPYEPIYRSWYAKKKENEDIFTETIVHLGLKGDKINLTQLVVLLGMAADIICDLPRGKEAFHRNLEKSYLDYFRNTPLDQRPKIEVFDNYLYSWAMKVWPRALDIISKHCRR